MVDIQQLSAAELCSVVETYPWFAAARSRLCHTAFESSGYDAAMDVLGDSLCHLPGNSPVVQEIILRNEDYSDSALTPVHSDPSNTSRTFVAGMDYFSREDYESAKREGDADLSKIAIVDYSLPEIQREPEKTESEPAFNFVTETLAEIYIDQGYPEQAIEIYTQLSLQMPEKSAYFASLIDKLKQ